MNKLLATLASTGLVFAALSLTSLEAEAKRLGGGGSVGMQRSAPASPSHQAVPPKPAAPAQQAAPAQANPAAAAAPAAAQQAGKRSWLGPIAGLAAGIGLAALLSHFGMGETVANFLMIALLVMAVIFVLRLLFRKREAQPAYQYAGATHSDTAPMAYETAKVGAGDTVATTAVPADFDTEGFLRQAKLNFIRLQAANDRGDLDDLKNFTTPEVFAEIQMQYQERGRTPQQTDVVELHAGLIEVTMENALHVASVRFHGMLREDSNTAPAAFDEIWHLTKPVDGSFGWRVAGIQQNS